MITIKQPTLVQDLGMLYPTATSKKKYRYGIYLCECGTEFKSMIQGIKSGNTNSCGCYKARRTIETNTKHGLARHPIYVVWINMIQRTTNTKHKNYKDYGGRGISVCNEWTSFESFYCDMGESYRNELTLDRIDVNGNYELANCRWVARTIQARNTRVLKSNNKSGYRGVSWNKKNKCWRAYVGIKKKQKHLGCFKTALEGARAYDKYVLDNNLEHTINGVSNV